MNIRSFDATAAYLPDVCFERPPDVGLVLGSGWGRVLEMDRVVFRAPYGDLPLLGAATIPGHTGEFVLYERGGKRVAAWCGRRHHYEGVPWEAVVAPVEILRRMGTQKLLLTNAAGALNPIFQVGDVMVLGDHINLTGLNPLQGPACDEWGPRFPAMGEVYSASLSHILDEAAHEASLVAHRGVYAFSAGPSYETPAEVAAYRMLGADAIGMSTVPEAVFAKACGFELAALSLITNAAAGAAKTPLSHEGVIRASDEATPKLKVLIEAFLARL